jgi:hypothetical protein
VSFQAVSNCRIKVIWVSFFIVMIALKDVDLKLGSIFSSCLGRNIGGELVQLGQVVSSGVFK